MRKKNVIEAVTTFALPSACLSSCAKSVDQSGRLSTFRQVVEVSGERVLEGGSVGRSPVCGQHAFDW
jgi:hypothetical protein